MSRTNITLTPKSTKSESDEYRSIEDQKELDDLRELFMLFDTDNDGFISFLDLKNVLTYLGEYESDHGIEELIKKVYNSAEISEKTDIRSLLIDFERFAQVFLYYYVNDYELDEDEEVLSALSNSPTTTAVSASYYSNKDGRTSFKKKTSFTTDSPRQILEANLKKAAMINRGRPSNTASKYTRRGNDSLHSAYEFSELIQDNSSEGANDDDEEPKQEVEQRKKEKITLDEFVNRQVFRALDLDGNGSITIGELKDLVLRYCPHDVADELDEDRLIDMLHLIDINSDGQVQYDEFIKLIGFTRNEETM